MKTILFISVAMNLLFILLMVISVQEVIGKRKGMNKRASTFRKQTAIRVPTPAHCLEIAKIAADHGYKHTFTKDPRIASFIKGDFRVNIYYSSMTVATSTVRKGNQTWEKKVSMEHLDVIFKNV